MLTFSSIGVCFIVYVVQACRLSQARVKLKQTQRYSLLVCQDVLGRDLKLLHDLLSTKECTPWLLQLQEEWRVLNKQAHYLEWISREDHLKMEAVGLLQTSVSDLWWRAMSSK